MHRLHGPHHCRETGVVDRHGTPAQEFETLLTDDAHPHAFAVRAQPFVLRHEEMAHRIVAGLGQLDLEARAFSLQEGVRYLDQDAGAVSGDGIRAHRTAMLEVLEDIERILDDVVRRPAPEIGDEADAAGVVFPLGIKQSPPPRRQQCAIAMGCGDVRRLFERHWPMPSGLSCLQWVCRFLGAPRPARPSKRARNPSPAPSRSRTPPLGGPPLAGKPTSPAPPEPHPPRSPGRHQPRSDGDCAQVPGRAYPCGADHPSQRVPCTMGAPPVVAGAPPPAWPHAR